MKHEQFENFADAVVLILVLLLGGMVGWFAHPDTKEVVKNHCFIPAGSFQHSDLTRCDSYAEVGEEKVISVLAEKKECEEKGGTLSFTWWVGEDEAGSPTARILKCVRPYSQGNFTGTEKVFEYNLTN